MRKTVTVKKENQYQYTVEMSDPLKPTEEPIVCWRFPSIGEAEKAGVRLARNTGARLVTLTDRKHDLQRFDYTKILYRVSL